MRDVTSSGRKTLVEFVSNEVLKQPVVVSVIELRAGLIRWSSGIRSSSRAWRNQHY